MIRRHVIKTIIVIAAVLINIQAGAEARESPKGPIVIYSSDAKFPITKYTNKLKNPVAETQMNMSPVQRQQQTREYQAKVNTIKGSHVKGSNNNKADAFINALLPIKTPNMTPGKIANRKNDMPFLTTPVFLIGEDSESIKWLKQNHEKLKTMGAIGLIVDVSDQQSLRNIAKLGSGIKIMPASGKEVAQALNIEHYPVLITKNSIEQ